MLMMPWNRPRLRRVAAEYAATSKAKDLVAYWIPSVSPIPERYVRVTDRALRAAGTLRDIDLRRSQDEVDTIKALYNRSWERNWGFVP